MDFRQAVMGLGVALLGCTGAHAGHHGHRFDDASAWAARFDDPSRDAWQKPEQVIEALALPPDAVIADLGSATGYFSVRLARRVPQGKVFGVDVEHAMVEYLAQRAEREGLSNLTAVEGSFDDAKLPEAVDLVLVVDTYHHLESRPAYFATLSRTLRPGGRIAIIDYTATSSMGPPPEAKVSAEQVRKELGDAGLSQVAQFDFLPEQYFLVFSKSK